MNLLLMQYNNYFNRKVLKQDYVQDYLAQAEHSHYIVNVNFNPNDEIVTEQVINWSLNWNPDYLVCVNEQNQVVSRWFITGSQRTRGGQYRISLKRDTVADFLEVVKESPIFLEKGTINDLNDKFIYNNENFPCNQIKKWEVPLYDISGCPWLVLYLAKGNLGTAKTGTITKSHSYDYTATTKDDFEIYHKYSETEGLGSFKYWQQLGFITYAFGPLSLNLSCTKATINYSKEGSTSIKGEYVARTGPNLQYNKLSKTFLDDLYESYEDSLETLSEEAASSFALKTHNEYLQLKSYENKILYVSSEDKYYKIKLINKSNSTTTFVVGNSGNLYNYMTNFFNESSGKETQSPNEYSFYLDAETTNVYVKLEKVDNLSSSRWSFANATDKTDSPLYDVICIPYGEMIIKINSNPSFEVTTSKDLSEQFFNSIGYILTSENVYDYQIIPYCPLKYPFSVDLVTGKGKMIISSSGNDKIVLYNSNNIMITSAFVVPEISYSGYVSPNLPEENPLERMDKYNDIYNIKRLNDCQLYRLCSPNYNGLFEFGIAKNGFNATIYNYDITLKPQTPYIHVNPDFFALYGTDFNDSRGLICGGDFSIGIINNEWQKYEIQNKNYQSLFDRQIQNMEISHELGQAQQVANTALSMGKSLTSGNYAGAGMSGISTASNLLFGEMKYQEQKSYTTDVHNYQLSNIRALPNSITKSTPLTNNNKLVPFLEIYDCTDEEKQAYMDMLTYDGMTIGKITKISNYLGGFIKGKFIRLEGLGENSKICDDIYNEISRGVYIYE